MIVKRLAAALAVSFLVAGAASAQPAGADSVDSVRETCAADFQKVCPDAKPGAGALKQCARSHWRELSDPCKSALKSMRARMHESQGSATPAQ